VRNEAIVSDRDELADKCMGLDSASLADPYSLLYLNERTDEATVSNCAPIEIDWLNYSDVFPERYIDNPSVPNFRICHKGLLNGRR
jgi:hypothetical protein